MKYMRMLAFVLIGLVGVFASISIIFTTVMHLFLAAIAGQWGMVILLALTWFGEMLLLNYVVNDYHGE